MNTTAPFVALKKLTGKDIVRIAARHNLREIQAEIGADGHIDHTRIGLNRILAGAATAAEVAAYAERLMSDAGVGALRRDAVRGVEVVISLPPASTVNQEVFFADSLAWVREYFKVPVLSAVIHRDESAPHCHIVLLPLVDGRMSGSDLVGYRTRLQAIQAGFFEQVGQRHGLIRPKAPIRLNSATREKAASLALSAIAGNPDLLMVVDVEKALLGAIGRDPGPLLVALGITMPTTPPKPGKTFVEIMTKPCSVEKPAKPIGFQQHSNPIGFASGAPEKEQTLSCVGFAFQKQSFRKHSTRSIDITTANQSEDGSANTSPDDMGGDSHNDTADIYTRCRDDLPTEYWDSDLGEYRTPPKAKTLKVRSSEPVKKMERHLDSLNKNCRHGSDATCERRHQ